MEKKSTLKSDLFHLWFLWIQKYMRIYHAENKQEFSELNTSLILEKTTISSTLLIDKRSQEYCRQSDIAIFEWKIV